MTDGPDERAADVVPPIFHLGGLVPFTTTDYPGKLAAVVFAQGCPWRCGYCHNPHLLPARGTDEVDWGAVLAWLDTRRGLLDAVVFSGGEPTAQAALGGAMRAVRDKGFGVGLHTGGIYPRRLAEVVGLCDWVGLDIKAPIASYAMVTGVAVSGPAAFASLDLLQRAGVALEVRTTVHPLLTPPPDLLALAGELAACGVRAWTLQMFRPVGCANDALNAAAAQGARVDEALLAALRERIPEISLR
jgi:pyruvate formate lyase activating enzyme